MYKKDKKGEKKKYITMQHKTIRKMVQEQEPMKDVD